MDILLPKKSACMNNFQTSKCVVQEDFSVRLLNIKSIYRGLTNNFRWIKIFLKGCEIWNNMSVMRSFTKNQQNNCQVFSRRCETDCHIEKANWSTKDIQEARNLVSLQSMIWNFMCGYRVDPKSKLNLLNTVSIIYVFH